MRQKIKQLFLVLLISISVSSCAYYTYNNKTYADPDSALNAQSANLNEILNQVNPEPEPIATKAIILIPDYSTITDKSIKKGRIANVEVVDYVSTATQNDLRFMAQYIKKFNLFNEIEIKETADPEKASRNISGQTIVIYYKTNNVDDQGWYLRTTANTVKELKFDATVPAGIDRTKRWLTELKQVIMKS